LLLAVGFLSSLGCQGTLERCHPNNPYLKDYQPAYSCDAAMKCAPDTNRVNIEKVYFNQLLNELDDYYKARQ
jgi:hypothetical protein